MTDDVDNTASSKPAWGRVLICGGTDWPRLGRKEKVRPEDAPPAPDLLEPHILRSLVNVKVASIHTSCAGCHFVAVSEDGVAYIFGRNTSSALGVPTRVRDSVSENAPLRVRAPALPGGRQGTTIVHAACGRSHTLLVGSEGQVWTAGANQFGQCGHPPCGEVTSFKPIRGPWSEAGERPIKASAGLTFSLVLTDGGQLYAFGSGEKGQLGNGRTGEHIVSAGKTGYDVKDEPVLVKGLEGKKIIEISSGQQHSIALDDKGFVYVWGYNGYCRLGLGNQQDILLPKLHPSFAGPKEVMMGAHVIAGPTCSVVIDRQGMYWLAGKWKNSGDGSAGQPYSNFRYLQDIQTCKMTHASCGGVTLFALAAEEGGTMTIAWGQNAGNGELGLGADKPKSATKPQQNEPLAGIDVFDVAAGQNTTLFLVRSNEKFSDLPRHPEELEDVPDACEVCGDDDDTKSPLLECDKCDHPYHLACLTPALTEVPEGEWFCPSCADSPGGPVPGVPGIESEADDEEMDDVDRKKRKAPRDGRDGGAKRKR